MKSVKPCRTDIKILSTLHQEKRTYAGNLIYGARLRVNVGDRLAKKIFPCVATLFWKRLNKMCFVSYGHCTEGSMNFNFSIASIKSNYGNLFPPQTSSNFMIVRFAQSCWLREQKINNCPSDTLISLKSYVKNVEMFCAFEVRLEVTNTLVTRDNILHRKRTYLQKKKMEVPYLSTILTVPSVFRI